VIGTSGVSACLPWIVSGKDPNSAQDQVQGQHRGRIAVGEEAFGNIVVVVVHAGPYAAGKDMAFDSNALVVGDDLVAVATEPDQVEFASVLDDSHSVCLRRLLYLGVVKDTHLVVLKGPSAASHRWTPMPANS
jgi:hypothetical protein